jgi:hypothetical protein
MLTRAQRQLRARQGAYVSWANTSDPTSRTEPARRAFLARFARQIDPDGQLTEAERQRRAAAAMKAYFTSLALRSSMSRGKSRRGGSAA